MMMPQAYCPLCGDAMTEVEHVRAVTTMPLTGLSQNMFLAHEKCLAMAIRTTRCHWHAEEKERRRAAEGIA